MVDGEIPTLPDVVLVECYAGYRGEQEPRRFTSSGVTVNQPAGWYYTSDVLRKICDLWERIPSARQHGATGRHR